MAKSHKRLFLIRMRCFVRSDGYLVGQKLILRSTLTQVSLTYSKGWDCRKPYSHDVHDATLCLTPLDTIVHAGKQEANLPLLLPSRSLTDAGFARRLSHSWMRGSSPPCLRASDACSGRQPKTWRPSMQRTKHPTVTKQE